MKNTFVSGNACGGDFSRPLAQWATKVAPTAVFAILSMALVANAQAETVFVTLEKDNALAVVDPVAGKLIKTVEIGQRPRGIVISPDNKFLYVAVSDDDTIKIIDAETLKETGRLPSGEDRRPLR